MTTELTHFLSIYSVLLPLLAGLLFFKSQEANARIMLLLLAFASIPQLASLFPNPKIKTPLYNLYILIDAVLWGYLFLRNIKIPIIKKAVIAIISIQLFVTIYVFAVNGIQNRFYAELICLHSLIQLIWVLLFFYNRYRKEEIQKLEHQSIFWFCLGILLYAPSTYFLFAFYPIIKGNDEYRPIWVAHDLLNTIMYVLFTFGFIVNIRRLTQNRQDAAVEY